MFDKLTWKSLFCSIFMSSCNSEYEWRIGVKLAPRQNIKIWDRTLGDINYLYDQAEINL